MKLLKYFLILSLVISSCKKEEKSDPTINLPKDYGAGMYILTDQGVSFYNYLAVDTLRIVTENIYKKVNNTDIIQPKSLHISGKQVYIIGDKLYIANMETFGSEGTVSGFSDPVSCKKIDKNRLYVVDKGASSVKIVDLSKLEVLGHIETGDTSRPANIVGSWFRAFVLNGGGDSFSDRDSSIVAIDYFQSGVAINDFSAKLDVGYNPNSAVFSANHLWVLCKGVYNSQDPSQNRQSTMYKIAPWSNVIDDDKNLTSIYNADNLAINESKSRMFFSSTDGIYITDLTIYPILHIPGIDASFITINTESINDSTKVDYLYANDANQSGFVLKYEAWTGSFVGSIQVNGNALDVVFY
ncbi:MAG TPA: hypothetical protein EYQ06_00450 [Flavobacteriales bacterium]|nr:hypothetical protein [Flavobacteriales bacterium]